MDTSRKTTLITLPDKTGALKTAVEAVTSLQSSSADIMTSSLSTADTLVASSCTTSAVEHIMPLRASNTDISRLSCILNEINENQDDFLTIVCKDGSKLRASGLLLVAVSPSMAFLLKNLDLEDCIIHLPDTDIEIIGNIFTRIHNSMIDKEIEKVEVIDSKEHIKAASIDEINISQTNTELPLVIDVWREDPFRKLLSLPSGEDNLKDEPNNVVKYEVDESEFNNDIDEDLLKDYMEDSLTDRQDLELVENGKALKEAQLREKPKRRKLKREISDLLTNEDPEYKPQKKIKKNGITTRKRTLKGELEKTAYCSRCGKYFSNDESLTKHNAHVHDGKVFNCHICGKSLSTRKSLKNHLKGPCNPEKVSNPYCTKCSKAFIDIEALSSHNVLVHDGKVFNCHVCSKTLANKKSLKRHLRGICNPDKVEVGELLAKSCPSTKFDCYVCGTSIVTKAGLRTHMKTMHSEEATKHRCPLCTFETLFKADVKVHIVKKHTASEVLEKCEGIEKDDYIAALDKAAICQDCGRKYPSETNYDFKLHTILHKSEKVDCGCTLEFENSKHKRHHIHTQHLKDLVGCDHDQCWFLCIRKSQLTRHVNRSHNKDEMGDHSNIMCDLCGEEFPGIRQLKVHKKHEHDTVLLDCPYCPRKCVRAKIKKHIQTYHRNPGVCNICGKKVHDLKVHYQNVHVEEKKFKCDQCDRGFQRKSQIESHMMNVHLKLRPYKCRYGCEFAYNNTSNRNKHERKKHGGHYPEAQQNQPPQQAFPARHQESYPPQHVTSNTPSKHSDIS